MVDGRWSRKMEDFLLQLEMNYPTSLINERSDDFFVYPVPNTAKIKALLYKLGVENSISNIIFIVHNIVFTREAVYIWRDKNKLIIDYNDLYSMEVVNSILYLNEMDVSNGRALPVFIGLEDLVDIMRRRKEIKEGNAENYVEGITLLFKKSISGILESNNKRKQEADKKHVGRNLFGFLSKDVDDFETSFVEKLNKERPTIFKDSSRLSIKPFIKSIFLKDIKNHFELDESQVLLCYDDSFFKSSHISLLVTKENLYLRKDVSILNAVKIPLDLIQDIECNGLLVKKICITTKNGDKFQQEFDNAETPELYELPKYLKKVLL
jgi:hypothetical protein